MARICVFCGKELGVFERDTLLAGNVSQPACKQCWNRLFEMPQEERGRLALETGRALEPEKIMANLERYREREEKKARARQALRTGEKYRLISVMDMSTLLRCRNCFFYSFFYS